MKALLLGAGKGSRFQPHSLKTSKMLLPFLGVPVVGYPLKLLEDLGVRELVMNTHHLSHQVEEGVLGLQLKIPKINFIFEEKLLGGAGTLKKNEALLKGEDIIYLNGDSIFLSSHFFKALQKQHHDQKSLITFLVCKKNSKKNLWVSPQGFITGFREQKDRLENSKSYFFPGFALLSSECFSLLRSEDSNIFSSLVKRFPKRCQVYVQEDLDFFEVGYLSEYLKSTQKCLEFLFQNHFKSNQLKEVILRYFPNFNFQTQLKVLNQKDKLLHGENVQGLNYVQVKDFAVIGSHCQFEKSTLIERSVVCSGQRITSSHLFQNLL